MHFIYDIICLINGSDLIVFGFELEMEEKNNIYYLLWQQIVLKCTSFNELFIQK